MTQEEIRAIVMNVLENHKEHREDVFIEASAKHVHLSKDHVEKLFGVGHTLTKARELSQPGQFLCEERVKLVTQKGEIMRVAVLGPERESTQVELSFTDSRVLGLAPPLALSGELSSAKDVWIIGDKGMVEAKKSVIVPRSHIHMSEPEAMGFGVKDKDLISVECSGVRPMTFQNVMVRVHKEFALAMHIDYDEANACGFTAGMKGKMVLKASCDNGISFCEGPVVAQKEQRQEEVSFTGKVLAEKDVKVLKKDSTLILSKGSIITALAKEAIKQKNIKIEVK